jgi:hypothetical protein
MDIPSLKVQLNIRKKVDKKTVVFSKKDPKTSKARPLKRDELYLLLKALLMEEDPTCNDLPTDGSAPPSKSLTLHMWLMVLLCCVETPTKGRKRGKKASPSKQQKKKKPDADSGEDSDDDEQYEVHEILARRGAGKKVEYLVSWEVCINVQFEWQQLLLMLRVCM